MKRNNILLSLGLIVSIDFLFAGFSNSRSVIAPDRDRLFNDDWKFIRDSVAGAEKPDFDDSKWMVIDLPHDYSIMDLPGADGPEKIGPFSRKIGGYGNSTGQTVGGTGWYRKSFTLNKSDIGKKVILNFDGVYMEAEIWVNGKKAGVHKNGYTPFWFDITSLLNDAGQHNIIAVKVDNKGRNTRWYSGSGIYRNVHLTLLDKLHTGVWGVSIRTPKISQDSALVDIAVTIKNEKGQEVKALVTIKINDRNGRLAAVSKDNIVIPGGWKNTIPVLAIVDVCGYQYKWNYYEPDHQMHPQRIMYASESYPLEAYDSWKAAEKFPYVIGDFVWTSLDYLGEVSLASSGYVPAAQKSTFKIPD
jgi:Glycosyl hydrolases family 2, sugar binding domain